MVKSGVIKMAFMVSNSKLKVWRRCRLAYYFKYVEGLKLRQKSRPLSFGTLIHHLLSKYIEGYDIEETAHMDKELLNDALIIMRDYISHYGGDKDPLIYHRMNNKSSEHKLEIDLPNKITMVFILDGLAYYNDFRWLVEHKSSSTLPKAEDRWRDVQAHLYTKALEKLNIFNPVGVCWDLIKSKPPSTPKVLKNGGYSKAKCDTLPTKLESLGIKDKKLLKEAKENRSSYFLREFRPLDPHVTNMIWGEALSDFREMKRTHGKRLPRSPDLHCSYCDFELLCRTELSGEKIDYAKKIYYTSG